MKSIEVKDLLAMGPKEMALLVLNLQSALKITEYKLEESRTQVTKILKDSEVKNG